MRRCRRLAPTCGVRLFSRQSLFACPTLDVLTSAVFLRIIAVRIRLSARYRDAQIQTPGMSIQEGVPLSDGGNYDFSVLLSGQRNVMPSGKAGPLSAPRCTAERLVGDSLASTARVGGVCEDIRSFDSRLLMHVDCCPAVGSL